MCAGQWSMQVCILIETRLANFSHTKFTAIDQKNFKRLKQHFQWPELHICGNQPYCVSSSSILLPKLPQ
jgi:hypothetical protein